MGKSTISMGHFQVRKLLVLPEGISINIPANHPIIKPANHPIIKPY